MNDPNAMLLATPEGLVGQTLAERYQVQSLLGDGGMGSVYLAEHVTLRKRVAIKVLHHELCRDQTQVDRFLQEARAASMIGHENIVDIVDFGPVPGGSVFFAMEFLEGEDLSDLLKRERRLPWTRAKGLMLQILRALNAAHAKGIIHRDLKPANCFLVKRSNGRDFVKLLDFGIAKVTDPESGDCGGLTRTGAVFGTAKYMAPEQACGEPADARTDVYAAAVCLYEFLTGSVPYDGDNFMRVLSQHLTEPLTPPTTVAPDAGITPAVEAIIVKALSKKPEDRFQSMAEFAAAVEAIGPNGNLAASVYEGPMAVDVRQAQPNAGAGKTLWLPNSRPPSAPASAPPSGGPAHGRGGTLMLDPENAVSHDLEFGTARLSGPHGWESRAPSRPPSGPQAAAPVGPASGPHSAPPGASTNSLGENRVATTPPYPDTAPNTNAPGGDFTMFATQKRSPALLVALLLGGAAIAVGGGGLAAWLLLGRDDPSTATPERVVQAERPQPPSESPAAPTPAAGAVPDLVRDLVPGPPPRTQKPNEDPGFIPDPEARPEPELALEPPVAPEPAAATSSEPRPQARRKTPRKPRRQKPRQPKPAQTPDVLSAADVSKGFGKAAAAVRGCKGGIPGMKMTVRADIKTDGTVLSARAMNNKNLTTLTSCVTRAVKANAKFPKTTRLQTKQHTYKF